MSFSTGTFTKELTNDSWTIGEGWGVRAICVFCNSATSGTITGSATVGNFPSSALTIAQNKSVSFSAEGTGELQGIVIVAPAGCTLQIIAQI